MKMPFQSSSEKARFNEGRAAREAAEWLELRHAGKFTVADHATFSEWCNADPRHLQIYRETESAWRTFDRLAAFPHSHDLPADPDLLVRPVRRRVWPVVAQGLAVAAAVALAAIWWMRPVIPATEQAPVIEINSAPRWVQLPDGSEVEVNAGSAIEEAYTEGERRVRLVRGQAHFTVARNADRPFIVEVNGVRVRAVGTAFDVRLAGAEVEVLVTHGKVRVAPADAPDPVAPVSGVTDVVAGQRTVVSFEREGSQTPLVVETLAPSAMERAQAWRSARFVFDATPLTEVVARFNLHLAEKPDAPRLVVGDEPAGRVLVSGYIRIDNVTSFVDVLESNFGIVADRSTAGEIVLRRAP